VSETGGDDLAAARALFRSSSYPESNGGLESSAPLLNGIGTTYSRTINAGYLLRRYRRQLLSVQSDRVEPGVDQALRL
jgi:hypothetical protein